MLRTCLKLLLLAFVLLGSHVFADDAPVSGGGDPQLISTLSMNVTIAGMIPSRDGAWVYLLNTTDARVQRVNVQTRDLDSESIEVDPLSEGMCISPNGKTIYVFVAQPPNKADDPKIRAVPGKVHVIDAGSFRITKTVPMHTNIYNGGSIVVGFSPFDMTADDKGTLYTFGSTSAAAFSVEKKSGVTLGVELSDRGPLRLHPDGKRLYHGTTQRSPGRFYRILLPNKAGAPYQIHYNQIGRFPAGGDFILSGDGKFLIGSGGSIMLLSLKEEEDLVFHMSVDPHQAAALDEAAGLLFLACPGQVVKVFSYPDFVQRQTFPLPHEAFALALVPATQLLLCAVGPNFDPKAIVRACEKPAHPRANGDILIYDVTMCRAAGHAGGDGDKGKGRKK